LINTRKDNDYWDPARKGFITNYPNFPHWKKMTAADMQNGGPLNLYLHSPFCIQRCSYCYYKTINLRGNDKKSQMDSYVQTLCREIELASDYYGLKDRQVISVYFGGGTPSLLAEDQLEKVVDTLHRHFKIENPEFTVEAEPVTLTKSKAAALKQFNVNRISMGIQSFDDTIIKDSHRLDSEKAALKAVDIAKETGAVVNIDLMSGLAKETQETWAHSVKRAIETEVDSITVYKTELYANTPYYKSIRKDGLELPSDDQEISFMQHALDQLTEADYVPWSFYTFTKGGNHVHVHSPSIFQGDDCYALGVSAFGRLGDFLFQNTNMESRYQELLGHGQLPIHRGYALTSQDKMIRDVVLGMKLISLNLRDFEDKYGFRLESLCASPIEQLQADNFISMSEDSIALTSKGILYGDYAGKSLARHLMHM